MGYAIDAVIGAPEVLAPLARAFRGVHFKRLADGLALVPLNEVVQNSIQSQKHDPEEQPAWPFCHLSPEGATNIAETCTEGALVYVEAEFFAGAGRQASVGWRQGALRHGPVVARDAINQALRFLQVAAANGKDEFDTVGLGRFRSTEEWDGRGPE